MRAITHGNGPAMVLAGPGSGKTFVIAERIKALIELKNVDPGGILTITFTRKAAAQMRQRFMKISQGQYPQVVFGTFHSVFYQILKLSETDSNNTTPKLINEQQKYRIVSMLLEEAKKKDDSLAVSADMIRACILEIGRLKGQGLDEKSAAEDLPFSGVFAQVFTGYDRMLNELGLLDFDDMILRCLRLLKSDEKVLRRWQERFTHILIDEYQDINSTQSEAISLIALPQNDLFVVGDDDQSIYGFRGSKPEIMLGFKNTYENAVLIQLNVNYRSVQEIIDVSEAVIGENSNRFEKHCSSGVKEVSDACAFSLREYHTGAEELGAMAEFFSGTVSDTRAAVIVRTNSLAEHFAGELILRGIPAYHDGGIKDPYSYRETEDILAYLRLCGRRPELEDLFRVMNRPFRYLSRERARRGFTRMDDIADWYRDMPLMKKNADALIRDIRMAGGMRPALAIRFIRKKTGYDSFVETSGEYGDPGDAIKRLDALTEEAGGYNGTAEFLRAVSLKREMFEGRRASGGEGSGVQVITMHASKGLEYDAVWLPGLNEGTVPSKRIVSPAQIEEERRLLYVAMTRARTRLVMSYLTGSESGIYAPSRYLSPLKKMTDKSAVCRAVGT